MYSKILFTNTQRSTTLTALTALPVFPYITAALTRSPPLLDPGPSMTHFQTMLLMPCHTTRNTSSHSWTYRMGNKNSERGKNNFCLGLGGRALRGEGGECFEGGCWSS